MKDIKGIGFVIPLDDTDNYINIGSFSSLSECDIVIFEPSLFAAGYHSSDTFSGKLSYDHVNSVKIAEHASHWNREIMSYLKSGKTLFINLVEKNEFYIQTGKNEYSGTGKNRQIINLVKSFSNYDFLPKIEGVDFNFANGKIVKCEDSFFFTFFEDFKDYMCYQVYLTIKAEFKKCFVTKNKDKILGGIVEIYGGRIVFLPNIDLSGEEFYDEDNDKWNSKGKTISLKLFQHLIEIDNLLTKSSNKTPRPTWLANKEFEIKKSKEIRAAILKRSKQIDEIKNVIFRLELDFNEAEKLNDLLFESGAALENAVTLALSVLGYKAENFDDGTLELDQIIVSPEGVRYIGECEGKDNKQIDITKFRQLSDALNEDYERVEVIEKAFGLLIGNPFRFTLPNERIDSFTLKCINGAKREKIGLIETKELYRVAKYLLDNKDDNFKKLCRDTIHNNLGDIIIFPEIPVK